MRNYHNIESRKLPGRDYYTGYDATGRSWRVYGTTGNWHARANVTRQGLVSSLIGFERLSEISERLAAIGSAQ